MIGVVGARLPFGDAALAGFDRHVARLDPFEITLQAKCADQDADLVPAWASVIERWALVHEASERAVGGVGVGGDLGEDVIGGADGACVWIVFEGLAGEDGGAHFGGGEDHRAGEMFERETGAGGAAVHGEIVLAGKTADRTADNDHMIDALAYQVCAFW